GDGFLDLALDDLLRARRERVLARGCRVVAAADYILECFPQLYELDAEGLERAGGDGVAVAHDSSEELLGPDVVVVLPDRFILCQREHAFGTLVEAVERTYPRHGRP